MFGEQVTHWHRQHNLKYLAGYAAMQTNLLLIFSVSAVCADANDWSHHSIGTPLSGHVGVRQARIIDVEGICLIVVKILCR